MTNSVNGSELDRNLNMDLSSREGRRKQGNRIKLAAREVGVTLDELALLIGCSRALIFQYASGASLAQSDRLQLIAKEVKKPLYWFFLEEDESQSLIPNSDSSSNIDETSRLQLERTQFNAEKSRFEQRRTAEAISRLESLLAVASTAPDPRKLADFCQQISVLLNLDEDAEKLASIFLKQGNCLIQLQEWGAAKEKLEQASSIYRQLEKPVFARDCCQSLGHVSLMQGRVEEALKQFEYVASGEDWTNRWQGKLSQGAAYEVLGEYASAIHFFEKAMEVVEERSEESGAEVAKLYIEANWSNLELDFGDFESALRRSQRTMLQAQRQGVQDQYLEALLTHGSVLLHLEELPAAAHHVEMALGISTLVSDQQHRSLALSILALCDLARHLNSQAVANGKEALAIALRCSAARAELFAQRVLSEAYLASSNSSEAAYHARQGLIAAQNSNLKLPQSQFRLLLSRAHLIQGLATETFAEANKALLLSEELHARPVQFESHLVLATAFLKTGQLDEAQKHAKAANELCIELKTPFVAWKGQSLSGNAHRLSGNGDAAKISFDEALISLELFRRKRKMIDEEDAIFEDPAALELCQSWLKFTVEREGIVVARTAVANWDWPPLSEWLEAELNLKFEKNGREKANE